MDTTLFQKGGAAFRAANTMEISRKRFFELVREQAERLLHTEHCTCAVCLRHAKTKEGRPWQCPECGYTGTPGISACSCLDGRCNGLDYGQRRTACTHGVPYCPTCLHGRWPESGFAILRGIAGKIAEEQENEYSKAIIAIITGAASRIQKAAILSGALAEGKKPDPKGIQALRAMLEEAAASLRAECIKRNWPVETGGDKPDLSSPAIKDAK